MLPKLIDALPRFELDGKWRCRGDRKDGEGDGEGNKDGEGEGDGEGDEGRRRYLKEDRDKQCPCVIRRHGHTRTEFGAPFSDQVSWIFSCSMRR
jgi:hypothetical protein